MRVLILPGDRGRKAGFGETIDGIVRALNENSIETVLIEAPVLTNDHRSRATSDQRLALPDWFAQTGQVNTLAFGEPKNGTENATGTSQKQKKDLGNWPCDLSVEGLYSPWAYVGAICAKLSTCGTIDGIIGFIDGAAVAAVLHQLLPWLAPSQKRLRFCVLYSGYRLYDPFPQIVYEPALAMPKLHIIELDPPVTPYSVPTSESLGLYKACGDCGNQLHLIDDINSASTPLNLVRVVQYVLLILSRDHELAPTYFPEPWDSLASTSILSLQAGCGRVSQPNNRKRQRESEAEVVVISGSEDSDTE